MIELKYKLLHYNKVTNLCHWKNWDCTKRIIYDIAITYFMKTLFQTLKFCWKIYLKNADISILVLLKWITCLIYPFYNLIIFPKFNSHAFWTILRWNWKCLEKSLLFGTLAKNAGVIKFSLASKLQNICDWIYNISSGSNR